MGLLRLWLAFSVLRFHTSALGSQWMPQGSAAVNAFFVLSGFAMALVLAEKYHGDRRAFWIQRASKLWLPYAVALALVLIYEVALWKWRGVGAGVVQELARGPAPSPLSWIAIGFSNLSMVGLDWLPWLKLGGAGDFSASHYIALPQAWSLSIELVFYALAPWYARLGNPALILIAISSMAIRVIMAAAGLPFEPWLGRLAPIEMGSFALGILAYRRYAASAAPPSALWGLTGWALLLSAPLLSAGQLQQSMAMGVATALALPALFGASRASKLDQALGEWAYPLYLLHQLLAIAGMDIAASFQLRPRFWALALASLAVSALFWAALRRPQRHFKSWLERLAPGATHGS